MRRVGVVSFFLVWWVQAKAPIPKTPKPQNHRREDFTATKTRDRHFASGGAAEGGALDPRIRCPGLGLWGPGVWGFRVRGLGLGVWGLGFMVWGLRFGVWGLGG